MKPAIDEPIGLIEEYAESTKCPTPVVGVARTGNDGRASLLAGSSQSLVSAVVRKATEEVGLSLGPAVMGTLSTSIVGMTEIVLEALETSVETGPLCGPGATDDDGVAAFGIAEAIVRRGQGMSATAFWRLMESYRLAYLELVRCTGEDADACRRDEAVIEDCFDSMKRAGVEFCLRSEAERDHNQARVVMGGSPAAAPTVGGNRPSAASAREEWGWPRVAARLAPRRRNPAGVV